MIAFTNPNLALGPTNVWYEQYFRNVLLGDRLTFSPRWSALVGVSRAELIQNRWGTGSALATPYYSQAKFTPSVALMFKPMPAVSTYASYMEGLVNGGVAPKTAANAYAVLGPGTSRQYELGAKADLHGVAASVAAYRIDKANEYLDPTDNYFKADGREVHQGVESYVSGRPLACLALVGGVSVAKPEVTRARNNPAIEGKVPVNVPSVGASLRAEFALPGQSALWFIGGWRYAGQRYVDATNTDAIPGTSLFEVGARVAGEIGHHRISATLNVQNLLNTPYWSYYRSGDGLLLGAPRVYTFSAAFEL